MPRGIVCHLKQNVVGYLALFVALGGTSAYAANTIRGGDIVDNEVSSADVRDDTLGFGGLAARDLGPGSVGASELANGAVGNAALGSRSVTADKLAAPDGWHYFGRNGLPGLQSGWVNYDSNADPAAALFAHAGYYIDNDGVVHLGGLVKNGTFGGNNPIVTLPPSLCPYYFRIFPVSSGNSIGRVTVNYVSAGGCAVNADAGFATYVSLDGIEFRPSSQDAVISARAAAKTADGAKTRVR